MKKYKKEVQDFKKEALALVLKERRNKELIAAVKAVKSKMQLAKVLLENECFDIYDEVFTAEDAARYLMIWASYSHIKLANEFNERLSELEAHVVNLEEEIATLKKEPEYLAPEKNVDYFNVKDPRFADN